MSSSNDSFQPSTSASLDPLFPNPEHNQHEYDMMIDPALVETHEEIEQQGEIFDEEERKRDLNRISSLQFRNKKNDQSSALEITIQSLIDENERLKKVISMMEGGNLDRTLGELATAAVEATGLSGFGFDNLNLHLENQSAFDFTQGLVTNLTMSRPPSGSSDPFEITRLALLKDLAETRASIAEKDAELAGLPRVKAEIPEKTEDTSALQVRLSVMRDMADRLGKSVAEQKAGMTATGDFDVRSTLLDIRGYVEGMLRTWKERRTLPTLTTLPITLQSSSPIIHVLPPSSLPKKRGRPARTQNKSAILPPALSHLLPDPEAVKARGQEMPLRRKGVKRNREELERDRRREEEEGELFRNLVGVGALREASLEVGDYE